MVFVFRCLLAAMPLLLASPQTSAQSGKTAEPPAAATVTQMIVKLREASPSPLSVSSLQGRLEGLTRLAGTGLYRQRSMSGGAMVLGLDSPVSTEAAEAMAQRLASSPEVEMAAPDYRRHIALQPDDPRAAEQWALLAPTSLFNGSAATGGANILPAWDISAGFGQSIIAVLDTGILPHAELGSRVLPGYDFISNSFMANDGNGRDNNPADPGDWLSNNDINQHPSLCGSDIPANSSWHGTHVSGIAIAAGNNATGIAGISWGSRILPLRVLGRCGGFDSDILDAMRWAAGLPVGGIPANPYPARIISLSLSGGSSCTTPYQEVMEELDAAGVIVVAATGNDYSRQVASPANCPHVLAVTAHAIDGSSAVYANTGSQTAISAPGGGYGTDSSGYSSGNPVSILSLSNSGLTSPVADSYALLDGTSQAVPHVSGVLALILNALPDASPERLRGFLTASSRPFPGGSWCTQPSQAGQCGAGLLDGAAALQLALTTAAGNHTPAATTATLSAKAGAAASLQLAGTDSDSDSLSFHAISGLPSGATLGTDGRFTWKKPAQGVYELQFEADDGLVRSTPATLTINVGAAAKTADSSGGGSADSLWLLLLLLLLPRRSWRRRESFTRR